MEGEPLYHNSHIFQPRTRSQHFYVDESDVRLGTTRVWTTIVAANADCEPHQTFASSLTTPFSSLCQESLLKASLGTLRAPSNLATSHLSTTLNAAKHPSQTELKELSPTARTIDRPSWSAGTFSVSGTPIPSYPHAPLKQAFPSRRIIRGSLPQHPSSQEWEAWAKQLGLEPVLGPMITTAEQRLQVLRLLHQYRHRNREDLRDLPSTDLITHRVKIAPATKPHSCRSQKRWPIHSLNKPTSVTQRSAAPLSQPTTTTSPNTARLPQISGRLLQMFNLLGLVDDRSRRHMAQYSLLCGS